MAGAARLVDGHSRREGTWDAARRTKHATRDLARAEALTPLAQALDRRVAQLAVFGGNTDEFIAAVDAVVQRAHSISATSAGSAPADPWQDFLARPADYFAMLQELGFLTEDEDAVLGGLPDEVVAAVRELELDTEHLSVSLRGYQGFAARFALVQRKVIIGDEMGLGKTIEALAVLAHLRANGSHHPQAHTQLLSAGSQHLTDMRRCAGSRLNHADTVTSHARPPRPLLTHPPPISSPATRPAGAPLFRCTTRQSKATGARSAKGGSPW